MQITKRLLELKQEAKDLFHDVPLKIILQVIASHLETEYSEHKNTEIWVGEVTGRNTAREYERRSVYFSMLKGPLNELMMDNVHLATKQSGEGSRKEQNERVLEALGLCEPLGWLSMSEGLIKKYRWKLQSNGDVYEVRPSNEESENAVMDLFRDSKTFQLFQGLGRNTQIFKSLDSTIPHETIVSKCKRLLENEIVPYPRHLVPKPGQNITASVIEELARSSIYERLLETNMTDFYELLAPGLEKGEDKIILIVFCQSWKDFFTLNYFLKSAGYRFC